jgi:hypothetical protein
MTKAIHGRINGRTIELSEGPGLSPGPEVEVQVRTMTVPGGFYDLVSAPRLTSNSCQREYSRSTVR